MGVGFGFRDWNASVPPGGEVWRERGEFNELSDRACAEQLRLVRDAGGLSRDAVVLISVVRNEALRLPTFFEHYRRLGVTRFVMVDNNSEDDSLDLLLAEPAATVFHTSASYRDSCCGIYWLNGIARAQCVGHWTLMADADELLVYDGMETHDLSALGRWLDRTGQDRLFAPMIDVYPPDVIGETGLSVKDNVERNSWFDPAGYALQRRLTGWLVTGGPRQRLFSNKPSLLNGEWSSKYPFFRMNVDTAVFSAHFIWPHMEGPPRPFGTLLHLKFMDDFAERVARNVREGQHYDNAVRYRVIDERLEQGPRQVVFHAKSTKYLGPESLIQHRLMLPIPWRAGDSASLPHSRTLGDIDYRQWAGIANRRVMSPGEREEFEDFSLRAFESQMSIVRCRGRLAEGEIGLICVLRNEAERLPLFFEHYKALGVSRFFMIDNNSGDGSRGLLLAEPLADVFHAHSLFSEGQGGLYWAQSIARYYGEGNWLIRPDADELFVYDGMENRSLAELASWLERRGMDRVYAPMIDLYPSSSLGSSTQTIAELIRTDSWFDNDGYSLNRWPQGWYLTGGPRYRVFSQAEKIHMGCMWKYPFFQMGPETTLYNHHWIWPDDTVTSGALGAVVHLKLMHDFIERSRRYEHEGQHWNQSSAYQLINKRLQEMPEAMIFYEGSKRYRGPRSLLRHGMMQPIDWDA
jgi:hypothetical protein